MLQSIGLGVLLVFIPLFFLGCLAGLQMLWKAPVPFGGVAVLAGLVALHYQRGDRFFLEQLTPQLFSIYVVEYLLLSSPVLFFFGRWGQWWNLALLGVGVLLLGFIRPPYWQIQKTKQRMLDMPVNWVPLFLWEWRAGLRQQGWWLLPLYLFGFWGAQYTAATPVLILFFAMTVCFFYQQIAPLEIIQASNLDSQFLKRKIGKNILFFQGLFLPHYLLFLLFQGNWQVGLAVLVLVMVSSCWISFSICLQYGSYDYNSEQLTNVIPLAIFIGGMLIPFCWPLLPFLWVYYWRKANKQLNYYA